MPETAASRRAWLPDGRGAAGVSSTKLALFDIPPAQAQAQAKAAARHGL